MMWLYLWIAYAAGQISALGIMYLGIIFNEKNKDDKDN